MEGHPDYVHGGPDAHLRSVLNMADGPSSKTGTKIELVVRDGNGVVTEHKIIRGKTEERLK